MAMSVAAFFISYVLTAGPVAFFVKRADVAFLNDLAATLYAPLIFMTKHVPVIGPVIKAWVRLFQ